MAKWPVVRVTEDGNKVFRITCPKTGVEFEHEQKGRGRPPVFAPEERERRKTPERTPRKSDAMKLELSDEAPQPGDIVMRIGTNVKSREAALRWATPVRLLSVDGDTATVERKGEKLTTKFANLVKLNLN